MESRIIPEERNTNIDTHIIRSLYICIRKLGTSGPMENQNKVTFLASVFPVRWIVRVT